MPNVITMKDGRNETVFDEWDFMNLLEEYMGWDARRWLEDWLGENDDVADYIDNLESEMKGLREHHKDVARELREQSEVITKLILEKSIDRKALSTAAGKIGTITWRELNV